MCYKDLNNAGNCNQSHHEDSVVSMKDHSMMCQPKPLFVTPIVPAHRVLVLLLAQHKCSMAQCCSLGQSEDEFLGDQR